MQTVQPNYNVKIFQYFNLLYITGCRPKEPLDISRWWIASATTIKFLPLKNQTERTLLINSLPSWWVASVQAQTQYFNGFFVTKFRFFFHKFYEYPFVSVGEKESELYLFRYNKVKELIDLGWSVADIRSYFAWSTDALVLRYGNAQIFTH